MDRVRKTVPGGQTSNGKSLAAVRVESMTWQMQYIPLSGMEMSLAGQWDTVNGEVLRCPAVQASMDHDHQLQRHTISDVEPGCTGIVDHLWRLYHSGILQATQPGHPSLNEYWRWFWPEPLATTHLFTRCSCRIALVNSL